MAKEEKKQLSREEMKELRQEKKRKLIEENQNDARVIVAGSVEVKKIMNKLVAIDSIVKRGREKMFFTITAEQFNKIFTNYKEIEEKMDAIIADGKELELYIDYKERNQMQKLSFHRAKIEELLKAKKDANAIATEIKIPLEKVEKWILTINEEKAA